MRPHFKRSFRGMAQKDLLLSDACLPYCGHSFAFLLQAFSFSNKKKMPKRGYYISFDYSGTRRQSANPASSYRAAAAVAVRRVAASCKFCVNNFVQTLRADDIRPYLL